MDHLLLKSLHIIGVVLFFGNIIVTAMWKVRADKSRDARIAAFAQALVTRTDFIFTGAGAALVLISGLLMLETYAEGSLSTWWIRRSLEMFALSVLLWLAVLVPIQVKQARMAKVFAQGGDVPAAYWKLGKRWIMFGGIASLIVLAILILMVYKPT